MECYQLTDNISEIYFEVDLNDPQYCFGYKLNLKDEGKAFYYQSYNLFPCYELSPAVDGLLVFLHVIFSQIL